MCNAFSCIVMKDKTILWEFGMDNHHELLEKHNVTDEKTFIEAEITPRNGNYLFPDKWEFKIDSNRKKPVWFSPAHEEGAWKALKVWKRKLSKVLIRKNIFHPLMSVSGRGKPTKKMLKLLIEWDSVRDSVRGSFRGSFRGSVGDSVEAYVGSFFKLDKWRSVEHKKGEYPYQCLVDLWMMGIVPSYDSKHWRLHSGKGAKIIWKGTIKDAKRQLR